MADVSAPANPIRARVPGGRSARLTEWGVDSEYGLLRDVLLASPESFRWLGEENAQYSALVRETLRRGYTFDRELALRQHAVWASSRHTMPVPGGAGAEPTGTGVGGSGHSRHFTVQSCTDISAAAMPSPPRMPPVIFGLKA